MFIFKSNVQRWTLAKLISINANFIVMKYALKISRNLLILIIAILNAVITYVEVIIPYYIHPAEIAQATVIFITAVINALIVYFSTEEQTAQS